MENRTNTVIKTIMNRLTLQLTGHENRLAALNPKSVLQRGYSITTNKKTSLLVKSSADVDEGDVIVTELAKENLIESRVTKRQNMSK